MRSFRFILAGLIVGIFVNVTRADAPPDPLRLVPEEADLVVKIESPRKLIETGLHLDPVKQLFQLEAVQEVYDSTNFRLFYQLVAYYEKELGMKWPDILDRIAGGGIVFSAKFGPEPRGTPDANASGSDPNRVLLILQSTDEEFFKKFLKLTLEIIEQEQARRGIKEQLVRGTYHDFETLNFGKEIHAAAVGSALLISNKDFALHRALDLSKENGKKSLAQSALVADARRLLPQEPLAWLWFNLDVAHKAPQAKNIFKRPRDDAILTVLFGGLLDIIGRSPYVCAAIAPEKDGFIATVRMPRGLDGLAPELATHVPPANQLAPRPMLEPKDVLFSESFYFDPGKFWEKRKELFNAKQVKIFEDFDKSSSLFLLGNHFNQLVTKIGNRHRFVAVHQPQFGYPVRPDQPIPAFALIVEMKDLSLAKSAEALVRGAALIAGTQVKLQLVEENAEGVPIVGYRFLEGSKLKINSRNFVYNFSPCMAAVGDQLVACSTLELCHEIVGLLRKESQEKKTPGHGESVLTRIYSQGGAETLRSTQDQLIAQTILNQALTPADARQQVDLFIDWVRRLGNLRVESIYGTKDYRFDVKWSPTGHEVRKVGKKAD
jgi:hypothetical protein